MPLPTSYLTSAKNLGAILTAMQQAKAPERFTVRFLESLGFKGNADRLVIGVFKSVGLIDDQGKPTDRYYEFLDQTQSKRVLAEGVEEAYKDLFEINTNANKLEKAEIKNKFKTLSQGQYGDSVVDKMASTFLALASLSDFTATKSKPAGRKSHVEIEATVPADEIPEKPFHDGTHPEFPALRSAPHSWGGLHYNIQLILPESRDPKVYDALFKSLRDHLG